MRRLLSLVAALLLVPAALAANPPAKKKSAAAAPKSSLVERIGSDGFIEVQAEGFRALTPREKELVYWLTEASIAIDPVIYDQLSRFGLREKYILDLIASHPQSVDAGARKKILDYAKLFWANHGNHNDITAQKFVPTFTPAELEKAAVAALHATKGAKLTGEQLRGELQQLQQAIFDPQFEPQLTAKNPVGGLDIIQASANNFYGPGVTLKDLEGFHETHPLNSRVVKTDGQLHEEVYRAGTPDGRTDAGRYSEFLGNANRYLQKARAVAEPGQADVIDALIRYYQTGNPQDWIDFGIKWVQNNPRVDFANGFIEVYRDARGQKGTSQSFVSVTDEKLNELMTRIAKNAQHFEDRAPWLDQYKKQGVQPPLAKAIETVTETGDFPVTIVGDNLPNENEIREKYGTKSFLFTGSTRALNHARGAGSLHEFAYDAAQEKLLRTYGDEADDLHTALHEIIGHGSGKVSPKLTQSPESYLREYYSTLEEARADLMALWNVWDPKLKELGVISNTKGVAEAMYEQTARAPLTQLVSIRKGDTIEEDHQRDRQLIVAYIMDKVPGAIARVEKNGKHYMRVVSYDKMRQGVGMLLAELMRIKAEGDYDAIKKLIDTYAVHFDPKLRDEVVARYAKLDLPTYWHGINAELTAKTDAKGNVTSVTMTYPRDFAGQRLRYAAMYNPELRTER
jgi:dipeptidyl-peptidase III